MCKTHFFYSGRKCVAMVTAYYGKNGGKILRRELLPQFFTNSHEIYPRCLPRGVDVQDAFFDRGRKCVAMVTAYYGKRFGENWRFCYFYIFKAFRVKFCPHVGREVMCEIHSLTMVESVLPW